MCRPLALTSLLLGLACHVSAFYLPGVAPRTYAHVSSCARVLSVM